MNILLIEPNAVLAKTYTKSLEAAGHEIVSCSNAQQAILAADHQKPDVVLLEIQLIDHSGVEFLYEFRSYPEWQRIPIVLHTFVPITQLQIPSLLGIAAYAYKPATKLSQLTEVVNNLLPQPA